MFDDLRQQASFEGEGEQEQTPAEEEYVTQDSPQARGRAGFSLTADYFLGMTAPQRFVIAVMLLMMTCLLGTLFLLVTNKIWLFG